MAVVYQFLEKSCYIVAKHQKHLRLEVHRTNKLDYLKYKTSGVLKVGRKSTGLSMKWVFAGIAQLHHC